MRKCSFTQVSATNWPTLALLVVLVLTVVQLRVQGRIWFCECGQLRFWTSEADGPHTSQHLTDPYSFSHVQHGLLLFFFVGWAFRRWKLPWQKSRPEQAVAQFRHCVPRIPGL